MLLYKRYILLCVIGAEVVYAACLAYGYLFLGGAASILHRTLFETLPGFSRGGILGFVFGAFDILIFSLIFGFYMVWMHNWSIKKQ